MKLLMTAINAKLSFLRKNGYIACSDLKADAILIYDRVELKKECPHIKASSSVKRDLRSHRNQKTLAKKTSRKKNTAKDISDPYMFIVGQGNYEKKETDDRHRQYPTYDLLDKRIRKTQKIRFRISTRASFQIQCFQNQKWY